MVRRLLTKFSLTGLILTSLAVGGAIFMALHDKIPREVRLSKELVVRGWLFKRLGHASTDEIMPAAKTVSRHDEITHYALSATCRQSKFRVHFSASGFTRGALGKPGGLIQGEYRIDDCDAVKLTLKLSKGKPTIAFITEAPKSFLPDFYGAKRLRF